MQVQQRTGAGLGLQGTGHSKCLANPLRRISRAVSRWIVSLRDTLSAQTKCVCALRTAKEITPVSHLATPFPLLLCAPHRHATSSPMWRCPCPCIRWTRCVGVFCVCVRGLAASSLDPRIHTPHTPSTRTPPTCHQHTQAQRADLAAETGYTKIGKDLPDSVTLTQIIKSMPAEVSECVGLSCVPQS